MRPVKNYALTVLTAVPVISMCLTSPVSAEVAFGWTEVSDVGNPSDPFFPTGSVDYEYRMAKHEVTYGQYADVLKGVDAWLGTPYPFTITTCTP